MAASPESLRDVPERIPRQQSVPANPPAVVPLPHRSLVRPPPKPSATLLFYLISITRLLTERDCCAQGLLHAFLETPPSVVAKAHAAPTRQAAGAASCALGPIASGTPQPSGSCANIANLAHLGSWIFTF